MNDAEAMGVALALGRRGQGRAWPNPAVGCVLVRDGRVLGRGWTQAGGRPHAEAMALSGRDARGATAYVTLEPCAHASPRGPDCSGLLVAAGVARVVTALTDPDPRTAGQGHARLRAAGIAVTEGVCAAAAQADLAGFLLRLTQGRPRLTLKVATTLDGRIATRSGQSRWITGPLARRDVHAWRARHDAVLVGIGTALADNPELTVRDLGVAHQPVRVVVDSRLRLPLDSRLGQTLSLAPLWLIHGAGAPADRRRAWAERGARLISLDDAGTVPARAVMAALGAAGLTEVYCEGGAGLAAGLLQAGVVDRLVIYQAPKLIGGDGVPAIAAMGHDSLPPAGWSLVDQAVLGPDIRSLWQARPAGAPGG